MTPLSPDAYEAKRLARYERLLAAAARAEADGSSATEQAMAMGEHIPFGQPILVGHHSEKADRRYRARIDAKYRRGYELHKKAAALRERAEAAKRNQAIFSDDPKAVEKIEEKIARLEQRQAMMVAANKLVRAGDRDGLALMGFTDRQIERLFEPDMMGGLGFPGFLLTNNSANIRRLKKRVGEVEAMQAAPGSEIEIGTVRIVDNADENRLQIIFPGKPNVVCRAALKGRGFRWAPSADAWQRHRGADAMHWAKQIVNLHYGQAEGAGNGKD